MNTARIAVGATLFLTALFASGCAKPVDVEKDDARMVTTPEQERRAPTQPAVRPQDTLADAKQKAPTTASKKPVEEPAAEEQAAAEPTHTASELMGKRQSEVTALMGEPARVEQRAASTVWVYEGGDCALDVFFFLDMATSDERVLTVAPSGETAASAASNRSPTGEPGAADTANAPSDPEATAIDACYGKLRRS